MSRFAAGTVYDRAQLHADAKLVGPPGNPMAGIIVVAGELCIFWNPYKKLYANQWVAQPSEFWYSGEGTSGAMDETAGNRRLRDAEALGTPIQVFYKIARKGSQWLSLGSYRIAQNKPGVSRDSSGDLRTDLRFRLLADADIPVPEPLPTPPPAAAPDLPGEQELWDAQAREVAKDGSSRRRAPANQRAKRQSSAYKTAYVIRRAVDFGGTCESCGESAGWVRDDGQPHFQAHHLVADIDLVDWIAAVCGTCHDRLHHGQDRAARTSEVRNLIVVRHAQLGRPTFEKDALPAPASAITPAR